MALTISTIVPAYNCETTLARALDSILAQTFLPNEIIVVNDGSTDRTGEIIAKYAEKHSILYGVTQENSGPAIARNHGINLSKGDWISFLDSDDYWYPHHLKNLIGVITAHPDLAWAAAPYANEKNVSNKKVFPEFLLMSYLAIAHRKERPVNANSTLIRRGVLEECGGFREDWRNEEDLWLWFQIGLRYPQLGHSPTISSLRSYQPGSQSRQFSHQKELELLVHHTNEMIQYTSEHNLLEREDVQFFLGGRVEKILYVSSFISHHEYKKQRERYRSFLAYVTPSLRARMYTWLSRFKIPVSLFHSTAVYSCCCFHRFATRKKEVS